MRPTREPAGVSGAWTNAACAIAPTFEQCKGESIDAFAKLDSLHSRKLLLGFADPGIHGIALRRRLDHEDVLVVRVTVLVGEVRGWPNVC